MKKFGKNRSVDSGWLGTPVKYCFGVKGKYTNRKYKELKIPESELNSLDIFSDEWDEKYKELKEKYLNPQLILKQDYNKDFVIIEFYGKSKCLCAWRNNITCKVGMTFVCPIIKRNKKYYVKYKNQLISLETNYGWVF